jgi:hypothetical protein
MVLTHDARPALESAYGSGNAVGAIPVDADTEPGEAVALTAMIVIAVLCFVPIMFG